MASELVIQSVALHWAEPLIGAPWAAGCDGPESYDCWGLVRAVYRRRVSVDLPILVSDERLSEAELRMVARHQGWRRLDDSEPLRELDVVLMRHSSGLRHVGLAIQAPTPQILHAHGGQRADGRAWGCVEASDTRTLVLAGFSRFEGWRLTSLEPRA